MSRITTVLLILLSVGSVHAQVDVGMAAQDVDAGEQFTVPVMLSNVEAGPAVQAFEFVLSASQSGVQFIGGDFSGTLVSGSGWTVSCNTAISKCLGFSSTQDAFATSGTLVNLVFIAPSTAGVTTLLLNNLRFNGGQPSFSPTVPSTTITVGGGGSTNTAPSAPNATFPPLVIIGGRPEDEAFSISWPVSIDPEGDPITYNIDFALDSGFQSPIMSVQAGSGTSYAFSIEQAAGIMASASAYTEGAVSVGDALTVHARVTAFDGRNLSAGPSSQLTFVRAQIVNVDASWTGATELFEVYPNPASNRLNMTWTLQGASTGFVRIVDVLGRLQYEMPLDSLQVSNGTRQLDVSSWTSGTYAYIATITYHTGEQGVHRGTVVKIDP